MNEHQTSRQTLIQPKRKRGAQPGNKNSRGNCGNKNARGKSGNAGGKGAPNGNRYACKKRNLADELLKEYARFPEALSWLAANQAVLRGEVVSSDSALDRAMYLGLPLDF